MSRCGSGFSSVGGNGAPRAQIYMGEVLQHDAVPLIDVTGGIFQHYNARPSLHESVDIVYSKLTFTLSRMFRKLGRFIPNRTHKGHSGSQSSAKEPSATNRSGT